MKLQNKIIIGLLAMLGFSACTPFGGGNNNGGGGMCMYGPPFVSSFVVKGTVTDAENKPVENIRIVLRPTDKRDEIYFVNDTVSSLATGKYVTNQRGMVLDSYIVKVDDIDGADNGGEFATQEKILKSNDPNSKWTFENGVLITEINFVLEKKNTVGEGDEE